MRQDAAGPPADERIYRGLYAAIVQHLIPPGTKLPEDTLAGIYDVSRPRVRKVLARLATENIITILPNRGASVARPSVKEARDVFAARRILEAQTVAAVSKEATASEIIELRAFGGLERSAREHRDRRMEIKLSGEFHLKLAEIMGNQIVVDFLRVLISRTSLIIAVYETRRGSGCNAEEHERLVDLIEQRNDQGAKMKMEQHLLEIEDSLELIRVQPRSVSLREVLGNTLPEESTG